MLNFLKKIIKNSNDEEIKNLSKIVDQINSLEDKYKSLSDSDLKKSTDILKEKYKSVQSLDSILPDAFALVREASKRCLSMRHFDVQLIGGLCLHQGKIAEMRTGEGKTLVATLPAYLNTLSGGTVHVVTVNDYLAKRDSVWMGKIYNFLGLSVGCIQNNGSFILKEDSDGSLNLEDSARPEVYKSDIVYGTNNEFGFDYLRDNMAQESKEKVQRELDFAIVDEVDSILIDEARTPLIISGPTAETSDYYRQIRKFIPHLKKQDREGTEEEPLLDEERGHYLIDEKNRSIELTDDGYILVEDLLEQANMLGESDGLYSASNLKIMKFVQATLRANYLFQKNVHYRLKMPL